MESWSTRSRRRKPPESIYTPLDMSSLADAVSPLPTAACNSCLQASAAEDFVFTQYYPILRAARAGGAKAAQAR